MIGDFNESFIACEILLKYCDTQIEFLDKSTYFIYDGMEMEYQRTQKLVNDLVFD